MKKIISALLVLALLCLTAMPVLADGLTVTFTDDSLPEVGGTLTVDKYAMLDSGSITAEIYQALLEGYVIYSWYKNDVLNMEGTAGSDAHSYALTLSDMGCTIYVKLTFFEDDSFQDSKKCGEAVSEKIYITGPAPEFITTSLPDATVGTAYYAKVECSDPDARFSEIMGSQLSEFGMYLTQYGEIEGIPAKSGICHVNILAVTEAGGENSTSFDISVSDAPPSVNVQITTKTLPEAEVGNGYYVKLDCTDAEAAFSIFYNPGSRNDFDATGLVLTPQGEIKGVPTKSGTYTFTVCAAGRSGEDYMTYTLTVKEAASAETTEGTAETTGPTVSTAESTEASTDAPETTAAYPQGEESGSDGTIWWPYVLVALISLGLGIGITLLLLQRRK